MSDGDSRKILVCVRQVPDAGGTFRPDDTGSNLDETGLVYRINEYDLFAVEEAVRWKERAWAERITALSVGPERAGSVVRRAMEFGVDHGVHILTREEEPPDALTTASLIAEYASGQGFLLMLFGVMSEDLQRCQTGPMTAALLGIPHASAVISAECPERAASVRVEQEREAGRREILEIPLPALLAVQPGINLPRYPSLSHKLRARKQALERISCETLRPEAGRVRRVRLVPPPPVRSGLFLTGTPEEKAEKLVQVIHEKTGLL
jgi:electron transfer flavoprotein beta subunit